MKTFLRFFLVAACALTLTSAVQAVEKNGLNLAVNKTVIDNNDTRGSGYYSDRINRTQGLKASVKNTSFKEMPEGEILWTILVLRWGTDTIESFTGTEKLKMLKPAELVEMVIGKADTGGYKNYGPAEKDKTEWRVVIKQEGKEMVKAQSTAAFDSMAKRAVKDTASAKAKQ